MVLGVGRALEWAARAVALNCGQMPLLTSQKAKAAMAGCKRGLEVCQIDRPKSAIETGIWIISKASL
ncbi:MAG: hypothetical protein EBY21_00550 [Alphaproteobacteria bacterium]|nr:hypothetical protein [Alphaproteobacteria bacterium]